MFDSYADIFEERASDYHAAMLSWPAARDAEFACVLEPLEHAAEGLVCDMPSGGGYLARHLRPGLRYLAVEPASDFFPGDRSGLERVVAEIASVPLRDGSVDHIVNLAGLHHEPDLPAVFSEMRRLVRTGGRVVLADVAVDTPPAVFLNGFVAEHNPMGHDGHFLDERTAGLLAAASLHVVEDALVPVPWIFADAAEAGLFCKQLFGIALASPQMVTEALERDIGLDTAAGGANLLWVLRRIVCEAV